MANGKTDARQSDANEKILSRSSNPRSVFKMKTNLTWLFVLILLSVALDNVQSKKKSKSNVIVINNSGKRLAKGKAVLFSHSLSGRGLA